MVVLYPEYECVRKYCMLLLDGSTWSIQDMHYLVQKEPSSPSVRCKGSFLQTELGQQIPNTQGTPGYPELKCSKCIHRDSQLHCLRTLAQTDSTSSESELSFTCCINTAVYTAFLTKSICCKFQQMEKTQYTSTRGQQGFKFKTFHSGKKGKNYSHLYFILQLPQKF